MSIALKMVLAPLLLAQGFYVQRRALRLPEPEGARAGLTGHGPQLRLSMHGGQQVLHRSSKRDGLASVEEPQSLRAETCMR